MGGQSKLKWSSGIKEKKKGKKNSAESKHPSIMYRKDDRVAVVFWLEMADLDMRTSDNWFALRNRLEAQRCNVNTAYLKTHWMNAIDPRLDELFGVELVSREKLGWTDDMIIDEKMVIMEKRIMQLKRIICGGNTRASTAWNAISSNGPSTPARQTQIPRRRIVPEVELVPNPVNVRLTAHAAAMSSSSGAGQSHAQASCSSFVPKALVGGQDTTTEKTIRTPGYKLSLRANLPFSFESSDDGAASRDMVGETLPLQLFQGVTFYLLDFGYGTVGKALASAQEWLIKVHGGEVLYRKKYINSETIVIASYDDKRNSDFQKTRPTNIYSATLINSLVAEELYVTPYELADHVWSIGPYQVVEQEDTKPEHTGLEAAPKTLRDNSTIQTSDVAPLTPEPTSKRSRKSAVDCDPTNGPLYTAYLDLDDHQIDVKTSTPKHNADNATNMNGEKQAEGADPIAAAVSNCVINSAAELHDVNATNDEKMKVEKPDRPDNPMDVVPINRLKKNRLITDEVPRQASGPTNVVEMTVYKPPNQPGHMSIENTRRRVVHPNMEPQQPPIAGLVDKKRRGLAMIFETALEAEQLSIRAVTDAVSRKYEHMHKITVPVSTVRSWFYSVEKVLEQTFDSLKADFQLTDEMLAAVLKLKEDNKKGARHGSVESART